MVLGGGRLPRPAAKKLGGPKISPDKLNRLEVDRLEVDRSTRARLGERSSLKGGCSCPTGTEVLKKGGILACSPKQERGGFGVGGPMCPRKVEEGACGRNPDRPPKS